MDRRELKEQLIVQCQEMIQLKIDEMGKELVALQESSESETKSSMGDKYETSREMIMQERNKFENQKSLLLQQLSFLNSVNLDKKNQLVEFGTLVESNVSTYFVCAAIGIVETSYRKVFVISANSPIAQAMLGKKEGDGVQFNQQSFEIQSIT